MARMGVVARVVAASVGGVWVGFVMSDAFQTPPNLSTPLLGTSHVKRVPMAHPPANLGRLESEGEEVLFESVGGTPPAPPPDYQVPNTVLHNGRILKFGYTGKVSTLERLITLGGCLCLVLYRFKFGIRLRRGEGSVLSKVLSSFLAAVVSCLLATPVEFLWRELRYRPSLHYPEDVPLAESTFEHIGGLKVHALQHDPTNAAAGGSTVDGVCEDPPLVLCNHGFGANAQSWLPVMPGISDALGARVVAHDAPGFGMTERPSITRAWMYSALHNVAIARELAHARRSRPRSQEQRSAQSGAASTPNYAPWSETQQQSGQSAAGRTHNHAPRTKGQQQPAQSASADAPNYAPWTNDDGRGEGQAAPSRTRFKTVIMGHSMGGITAALAAVDPRLKPEETALVLVAPALGVKKSMGAYQEAHAGGGQEGAQGKTKTFIDALLCPFKEAGRFCWNWLLVPWAYPLALLGLRQFVYQGSFWKNGLRSAWYDKHGVTLEVVNRYRWPSLVKHWDRGMALFVIRRFQKHRRERVLGMPSMPGSGLDSMPEWELTQEERHKIDEVGATEFALEKLKESTARGMKVIIIHGSQDRTVAIKGSHALVERLPAAELLEIPECGHVPHEEKPEEFIRLVKEHLL